MMRKPGFIVALAIGLMSSSLAAHSQTQTTSQGPPNALQGFSQNRDQPVHIEAATLEVRDKQKQATFSGDVRVKQGDTGLRCKSLVVFYEQSGQPTDASKTLQAASPGPGGEQRIKRLEARGGVVVTQKDQTATGELGITEDHLTVHDFDVRTFPDRRQDILELLVELWEEWRPDVVFQPSHHDVHQDHQTIAQEGLRAFLERRSPDWA